AGTFNSAVGLSAVVAPASSGVTATLSTSTVTPGGTVMLTANVAANASPGAFMITVTGTSGQLGRSATVGLNVAAPDYSLSFSPAQVTLTRLQKGQFTVDINRTGGFAGNVTVTAPDTKPLKIKITQPSLSTTGTSVSFDFKVKKKAPTGTQQITFT